jgi:FkbM family methyltransferase
MINNFGSDNFDHIRFKDELFRFKTRKRDYVYNYIKYLLGITKKTLKKKIENYDQELLKLFFKNVYIFEPESKKKYINIFKYRFLGYRYVKINSFAKEALKDYKKINELILSKFDDNATIYSLTNLGFNIEIIYPAQKEFLLQAYRYGQYSLKGIVDIQLVFENAVVLDVGACYGDSTLLFSKIVGKNGKVFAFEMSEKNIAILEKNIALNNASNVQIINKAVSNSSNAELRYIDSGPGSNLVEDKDQKTKNVTTVTIDDFCSKSHLDRLDLIKMDIEGAETLALEGASNAIEKYRPSLAIAIYHGNDFFTIPNYLNNVLKNYKFYIGHYTIHAEETIMYCVPIERFEAKQVLNEHSQ